MTVLGFLSGKKIDKVVTFPRFDISEMCAQLHMHNTQILDKGHLKGISYIEEIVCSSMSQTPFNPQVWVEWYRFTWPPTKFCLFGITQTGMRANMEDRWMSW
jgi:hypothetical protein